MSDNDTHQPTGPEAGMLGSFRALILTVERVLPASRERSLTITKLEEAEMWAGKAVAR